MMSLLTWDAYVTAHRQQIIAALENWWDKYAVSLRQIEAERETAACRADLGVKVVLISTNLRKAKQDERPVLGQNWTLAAG